MSEIAPQDIVWRAGGHAWQRYGVGYKRLAPQFRGGELAAPTIARADATTCARFTDPMGLVLTAAANVPRLEWLDTNGDGILDTPAWLLEGAATNSLLQSQALGTTWTPTAITATNAAAAGLDGATTATGLVPSVANSLHYVQQAVTITANEFLAVSIYLKAGAYSGFALVVADAGVANGIRVGIDLLTGTLKISTRNFGSGTYTGAYAEALPGGWYRLVLVGAIGNSVTSAVTFCEVFDTGARADSQAAFAGDGTSGVFGWGAQLERCGTSPARVATSYIKTTTATVTRAAETVTAPLNVYPGQDLTIYLKMWLRSIDTTAGRILVQLGSDAFSATRLYVALESALLDVLYQTPAGTRSQGIATSGITVPGMVEARAVLAATGAVTLGVAVGGGAESASGPSATITPTPWTKPLLSLGHINGTTPGCFSLFDGFLTRGQHSLAECRAVP